MHREHRRELKHDRFVDEIGVLSGRARENQRLLITIGVGAIAIALIVYGIFFYRGNRERKAQDALAIAIDTSQAQVAVPGQPNPQARFKSEAERDAAAQREFNQVLKFGGTDAADVASIYLARFSADHGDTATARKYLQKFVADHPDHLLVGGARYSLYQLRIDGGEAAQVNTEINAELAKPNPMLPADSLLSLLAHSYEVQGNEQKSRDTYRRIATEYPDSPFAADAQRRIGGGAPGMGVPPGMGGPPA